MKPPSGRFSVTAQPDASEARSLRKVICYKEDGAVEALMGSASMNSLPWRRTSRDANATRKSHHRLRRAKDASRV